MATIDPKDGLTTLAATRTPPKDPSEFVREQAVALETARSEHLADRMRMLTDRSKLLEEERAALAKDEAPSMVLSLIDRALASTSRHIDAANSTLRAVKQAPPLDEAGYAMTGVLADANGKGPANGEVTLSALVGGAKTKIGTAGIGTDGMFYLALSAAATKQHTGQTASIDVTIAGKPYAVDKSVTITPGLIEVVTLPVLNGGTPAKNEPKPGGAPSNAAANTAASDVQVAKTEDTKPKTRVAARTVKKDQPNS